MTINQNGLFVEPGQGHSYWFGQDLYTFKAIGNATRRRGKGFATQVVQTALEDAQKLGYRVGILQASAMGKNVYQRIGFQECCPIEIYLWQPPKQ